MDDPENCERIFWFNGWHLVRLFVPLAVLVGLSVLVNPQPWREIPPSQYLAWGGGLAVFIIGGSLYMRKRYFLRLSPDGLEMHYPNRTVQFEWAEVSEFRVLIRTVFFMPAAAQIIFELNDDSRAQSAGRRLAGTVLGYQFTILAVFDVPALRLSKILNECRVRSQVIAAHIAPSTD